MFNADFGTALNRWPVVRLRGGCQTEIILLSRRWFSLTTHFLNRTVPCAGDGCGLCDVLASRGLFYAAVSCGGRVHLLELGAQSAANFEQHAKMLHGGMTPGLCFELRRRGSKSPVHSEVVRRQDGASEVPIEQTAARVMALYKFPPPNPREQLEDYDSRCREIALRRNELLAKELLQRKTQGV